MGIHRIGKMELSLIFTLFYFQEISFGWDRVRHVCYWMYVNAFYHRHKHNSFTVKQSTRGRSHFIQDRGSSGFKCTQTQSIKLSWGQPMKNKLHTKMTSHPTKFPHSNICSLHSPDDLHRSLRDRKPYSALALCEQDLLLNRFTLLLIHNSPAPTK